MAWIESHQELRDHPKTLRLAGRLGVHKMQAIGHLHALWWWCLAYADDGDLTPFDDFEVAAGAGWDGEASVFVDAMTAAGWLDGRVVHDWHEYAGKLVERRRVDAERKAAARRNPVGKTSSPPPPDVRGKSTGQPPDDRTDGVRTQPNRTQPNPTTPTNLVTKLPALSWAERWCDITGMMPTRPVLRFLVPKVQEFMADGGEPSEELLQRAHGAGIKHPGGWGFVVSGKREPIPDWAKELSL